MVKTERNTITEEEGFFNDSSDTGNEVISVSEFMEKVENYGEWKELIGFLKGKNLNPKLVKKYIEVVLEIEKLKN